MNTINNINQHNTINQVNQLNTTNQQSQFNQINSMNQMNSITTPPTYSSHYNQLTQSTSHQSKRTEYDLPVMSFDTESHETLTPQIPEYHKHHLHQDMSPSLERQILSPIHFGSYQTHPQPRKYPRPYSVCGNAAYKPVNQSLFTPITISHSTYDRPVHERPQSVPGDYNNTNSELTIPKELEIKRITKYDGEKEFATSEEALTVLTQWADSVGIVLRKGSGNNKTMKDGTKKKFVLVCQYSGKPMSGSTTPPEEVERGVKGAKKRRLKKTECPFRINLNYRPKTNSWNITKMVMEHNHLI